jgi:hypothetical protein
LKVADPLFPVLSVATHSTVVVPMGNVLSEGGTQATVGLGSTSSAAVTT